MIRTDGRPTIAMRESDPLPGQMTVEECIEQAEEDQILSDLERWYHEQDLRDPVHGGF